MKILELLSFRNTGPVCQQCAYFMNDPAQIEKIYPGLSVLSSGYASVRYQDGVCEYNKLYLSARDSCPHFLKKISVKQVP